MSLSNTQGKAMDASDDSLPMGASSPKGPQAAILSTNGSRAGGAVQPMTRVSRTKRCTSVWTFRSVALSSQIAAPPRNHATGGEYTTATQAFGRRTDFLFDRLIFMALSIVGQAGSVHSGCGNSVR